MDHDKELPICFVISPIGDEKSDVRKQSNLVFKHIIVPALAGRYQAIRADHISKPGNINNQVIAHIVQAPLLIADLTNHNPNVFYELAIRHVIKKPYIQIIKIGHEIPFDITTERTIVYDTTDPDSIESAKADIARYISAIEADPNSVTGPLDQAISISKLSKSENEGDKLIAELLSAFDDLRDEIRRAITTESIRAEHPNLPPEPSTVYDDNGDPIDPNRIALYELLRHTRKEEIAKHLLRLGFRSYDVRRSIEWAEKEFNDAVDGSRGGKPVQVFEADPFAFDLLADPFADP